MEAQVTWIRTSKMWIRIAAVAVVASTAIAVGAGSSADCGDEVLTQLSTTVETENGRLQIDVCVTRDSQAGTDTYRYTVTNINHNACKISGFGISQVVGVDAEPVSFGRWTGSADG